MTDDDDAPTWFLWLCGISLAAVMLAIVVAVALGIINLIEWALGG